MRLDVRNQRAIVEPDRPTIGAPPTAQLSRTSSSGWWLRPAIAVFAVLVAVAGIGRLGANNVAPTPNPAPPLSPAAVAEATPTPTSRYRPALPPGFRISIPATPRPLPLIGPAVAVSANGKRFLDGIPTSIARTPVVRVRDAAAAPIGQIVLVGGWYYGADCQRVFRPGPCPPATISDNPSGSPRIASLVLDSGSFTGTGSGARIFRAQTEPDPACVFSAFGECLPRLLVIDALWTGEATTDTAPIGANSLIGALAIAFPALDFTAYHAIPGCNIAWPSQAYLATASQPRAGGSTAPPIEAVLLFSNIADRRTSEEDIRLATYGADVVAPQLCHAADRLTRHEAHWVALQNVMVLVGNRDAGTNSIVDTVLNVAALLGKG